MKVSIKRIEDADALRLIISRENARTIGQNVQRRLSLYEDVRKKSALVVQTASLLLRTSMREQFGWICATDERGKLPLE